MWHLSKRHGYMHGVSVTLAGHNIMQHVKSLTVPRGLRLCGQGASTLCYNNQSFQSCSRSSIYGDCGHYSRAQTDNRLGLAVKMPMTSSKLDREPIHEHLCGLVHLPEGPNRFAEPARHWTASFIISSTTSAADWFGRLMRPDAMLMGLPKCGLAIFVDTAAISRSPLTSSQIARSLLEAQRLSRGAVLRTHAPMGHGLGIAID